MKSKKILILWAPLADYMVASFKCLSKRENLEISVVYQPNEQNAPYLSPDLTFCKNAIVYNSVNATSIYEFCTGLNPDLILMSSWNYSFYMKISKKCKSNGTYVISSFDGQWKASLKQYFGIAISSFFLKPCINNFFVPGDRQATFARKLGYPNPFIGYYSANSTLFFNENIKKNTPNFIFVGRLVTVKGISFLIEAYRQYRSSVLNPWGLIICGKGELESTLNNEDGVALHGFQQPVELVNFFAKANCLILPSYFEPWGVVVHEAALAGLSIICSHTCGASTFFVRDGQNGFIINPDKMSLLNAMLKMSKLSDQRLLEMSTFSKTLGSLWTTEKWANYVSENILNCTKDK